MCPIVVPVSSNDVDADAAPMKILEMEPSRSTRSTTTTTTIKRRRVRSLENADHRVATKREEAEMVRAPHERGRR